MHKALAVEEEKWEADQIKRLNEALDESDEGEQERRGLKRKREEGGIEMDQGEGKEKDGENGTRKRKRPENEVDKERTGSDFQAVAKRFKRDEAENAPMFAPLDASKSTTELYLPPGDDVEYMRDMLPPVDPNEEHDGPEKPPGEISLFLSIRNFYNLL